MKPKLLAFLGAAAVVMATAASAADSATDFDRLLHQLETRAGDDGKRVEAMSKLLGTFKPGDFDRYEKLCAQAKTKPVIGMTVLQARATTWCFPDRITTTTTAQGTSTQEFYARGRRYLHFENGMLTAIQE
jgi:hypothetical protein